MTTWQALQVLAGWALLAPAAWIAFILFTGRDLDGIRRATLPQDGRSAEGEG